MYLGHRVGGKVVDETTDLVPMRQMMVKAEAGHILDHRRDRILEDAKRLIEVMHSGRANATASSFCLKRRAGTRCGG